MINKRKIATWGMVGTLIFAGKAAVTEAAELPIAGINLVLHNYYQNYDNGIDIKEYLTANSLPEFEDISFAQVTNDVAEVAAREAREQTQEISSFRLDNSSSNSSSNSSKTTSVSRTESSNSSVNNTTKAKASNSSSIRNKLVEYALQFEGNPYIWGGTSLKNGADCSGFTQSVFRDNGIRIPRTSRTQATGGRRVSIDNIQPGDLIFYKKNGTINHVALYIGKGKVISASSPSTGIRIRNYDYRQPYRAVNYID
jgi:cell wall-associated NlpC family hydrolase